MGSSYTVRPAKSAKLAIELRKSSNLRLLSNRELQLLELASAGHTDREVSETLGLALGTLNMYWSRIRVKLGHMTRAELVALMVEERAAEVVADLRKETRGLSRKLDKSRNEQQELHEHLHTFEMLIDTAGDAILVIDEDGEIRLANEAANELFGHSHMKGMHIRKLVPPRYHGLHALARESYLRQPEKRLMGNSCTTALHKDGREIPVVASMSACETSEGRLVTCIFRAAPSASPDRADCGAPRPLP